MANSEITSPVYTDETAQENGKKLDTIAILLGNIAASQRAIANAQPEVSMDVDLNTVRQIVASGAARCKGSGLPARYKQARRHNCNGFLCTLPRSSVLRWGK